MSDSTQIMQYVKGADKLDPKDVALIEGKKYLVHAPWHPLGKVRVIKIRKLENGNIVVHYQRVSRHFLGIPTRTIEDIKPIADFCAMLVDLGSVKKVNLSVKTNGQ